MILNEKCYLVKGYKNAAIYDLNECKVYSLNEYGKIAVEKALNNTKNVSILEKEYILKLKEMNLLKDGKDKKKDKDIDTIKIPKPKVNYAWLELTGACNLRCIHCYGQFGYPVIDKNEMLTLNEWKSIIDKLISYNCREIQLIGGEPMIHKDFYEILYYAYKKGMERIDIFTNATLIDEKSIKFFKKTNAKVRVSVYGHNAEIHDRITKQKGSFEKTKKALELLKENNIETRIAVVIMKENEKYIPEIRNYINELGHRYTGYDVIRPSCISDAQQHLISNYNILKQRYNTEPRFWINENQFNENHFYNSCWNGKIAITAKGDIIPCIFARDEIVGNIRLDTIKSISENIIKKWSITKDNIEVCKDCEYRYCCHDCRPIAKGIEGSIYAKYPRCCYDPYNGKWLKLENYTKEIKNN